MVSREQPRAFLRKRTNFDEVVRRGDFEWSLDCRNVSASSRCSVPRRYSRINRPVLVRLRNFYTYTNTHTCTHIHTRRHVPNLENITVAIFFLFFIHFSFLFIESYREIELGRNGVSYFFFRKIKKKEREQRIV